MKLLEREEKEFVRIIIGVGTTRKSGVKAPTKTISVQDISVGEMWGKILKIIQSEDPDYKEMKKKRGK